MFKNILLIIVSGFIQAQIPTYYENIDFSQSPEQVKNQLSLLVRNTHLYRLSYTPQTWIALKEMDLDPENPENVLLIYGYNDADGITINDLSRDKDLSCHTTECEGLWSREHIYPRSIGNYDEDSWPGSDIHALRPCDGDMNEYRSNFPYVDGSGNAREITNFRFYPGDEWKGDVARMVMYMFLRYPNNCNPNWVGVDENSYHQDMPDIFLEWNAADPVTELEMNRNNLSEEEFQGNRNPFIDNPYLATLIWGGPEALNTWGNLSLPSLNNAEFAVFPNPTVDCVHYSGEQFNRILIYNLEGKLVGEDMNLSDNLVKLPSEKGLYFIKFQRGNLIITKKVIKN